METNKNQWLIFRSIWFWWIAATIVYVAFNVQGYPNDGIPKDLSLLGYIAALVGLFVPFGLLSLFTLLSPLGWISVAVFIVLIILANRNLKKLNLGLGKTIAINLLVLLVITTIVDFARFTSFEGWITLFNGDFSHIYSKLR